MRLIILSVATLLFSGCAALAGTAKQEPVDMALMRAVAAEVGSYVAGVLPAASTTVIVGRTEPAALADAVASELRAEGFALADTQQDRIHAYSVNSFASVLAEGVVLQIAIDGERASRFYQRDPDGAIWSGSPFTVASRGVRERAIESAVFAARSGEVAVPARVEPLKKADLPPAPKASTAAAAAEKKPVQTREATGGTSPAASLPSSHATSLVVEPVRETPKSVEPDSTPTVDVARKEVALGTTAALPVASLRATPPMAEPPTPVAPVVSAPLAPVKPATVFVLSAGETVRTALTRWCAAEGWTLVWRSDYDYPVGAPTTFPSGTEFKHAVRQVLAAYRGQEHAIEGRAYNNQVLEIIGRKRAP